MGKGDKKQAQQSIDWAKGLIQPSAQNYSNLFWGTGAPTGGGGGGYPSPPPGGTPRPAMTQQQFQQQFGSPTNPQELIALEPQLNQAGIKVLRNAAGVAGKIQLPDGQVVDVIRAAGAGGRGFQWLTGPSGGASVGGGMGGGIVGGTLGDYSGLMNRWSEFADTGGYSPETLAAIRSRAISPIRSIYSNAQRNLNQTRALQGGYSPGYSTALGRFNREQGQLTSDATTNAEAAIGQLVQSGRLAGLGGMSGMYSATPGLANMFGNQMLQSQQNALGLVGAQQNQGQMKGFPWGSVLSGIGAGIGAWASDKNLKTDIEEVSNKDIVEKFKKLKIYEWRYKGDKEKHIGPMAQDFQRIFGKGDGKSISVIDAIGTSLAMNKALAERL